MVVDAIVSLVLVGLLVVTAARKLSHRESVVATYRRVGVPEERLNALAALLLVAAVGLIVALWWPPAGVAAAGGLIGYFVVAIAAHIRAGDSRNLPTPLAYLALAAAVLVLHVT
jgi:hypothetical protein